MQTSGLNFCIALIRALPIPDEPPVTIITDVRFKTSEGLGIFCAMLGRGDGIQQYFNNTQISTLVLPIKPEPIKKGIIYEAA